MVKALDLTTGDFLCAFFDAEEPIHLRAFPPRGAKGEAVKLVSTALAIESDAEVRGRLEQLNATLGVYFVVNSGGDTDASIRRFTAWFAERDEGSLDEQHAALDALPLRPSIRVETRKSVHAYWLIEGLCGADEWRAIQTGLIASLRSDAKIKNPSRVMRLPGFDHITSEGDRKAVVAVTFDCARRFTAAAMRETFPVAEPAPARAAAIIPIKFGEYPTWDALNAEARRRICGSTTFRQNRAADDNGDLWGHCRALCHDGKGDTGIAINLTTGAYGCQKGCDTPTVLRALGLPERPTATEAKPKALARPSDYARPRYEPEAGRLPEKAALWFEERKISRAVLERNRVGAESRYFPQLGREVLAVAFPYLRAGEIVNVKYRGPAKTWATVEAAERVFYGLDDISATEPLVIVAGELDKLSVEEAGIRRCIGAPALPGETGARAFDYLDSAIGSLAEVPRFTIAVDTTAAGDMLARELARRLGPERCYRARFPEECEDVNDVLRLHGPDVLRECLDAARPIPVRGLWEPVELSDRFWAYYDHGVQHGASPGWDSLSDHYTVAPGQWTVVTGIPGSGKSVVLDNIAVNLARSAGWRFAVCSPETQPLELHEARLASIWAGEPFFEGWRPRMSRATAARAEAFLQEHFTFVLLEDGADLATVLDLARIEVARKGVQGIIIDPWNELEHSRPPGMNETEYVSQSLSRARRFARQYGVHIWLVAHPQKLYRSADGKYPVPTLYDISGSAHWFNKADMGLSVWRDKDDPQSATEVHVQKVRFKEFGRLGTARLKYDGSCERFYDLAEDQRYGS